MVREAKPPVIPPRPDMLRPRPRSPPPPQPSQAPPAPPEAFPEAPHRFSLPPYSPPSIYSAQTPVAASPNVGDVEKQELGRQEEPSNQEPGKPAIQKHSVKFSQDTTGGGESPPPETILPPFPLDGGGETKDETLPQPPHDRQPSTTKELPQKPARKPISQQKEPPEPKGKEKEIEVPERAAPPPPPPPEKPKPEPKKPKEPRKEPQPSKESPYAALPESQSLLQGSRKNDSGAVERTQQRQDVYRTHTRSAEARALYAEAKDHYGKAKNHLQEALRLSVDVCRLAPHVFLENVATRDTTNRGTSGSGGGAAAVRYVPEYPGIGVQYRTLFAPLLASVGGREETERKQQQQQSLVVKKRANDALARERAAVARHAAASSVSGSTRSGRSNATARSNPWPPGASVPLARASASAASRAGSQGERQERQRPKKRPVAAVTGTTASVPTRTAARLRDGSEPRSRTRTRSAAGRRMQRKKKEEEEVDHGIMWFFSY